MTMKHYAALEEQQYFDNGVNIELINPQDSTPTAAPSTQRIAVGNPSSKSTVESVLKVSPSVFKKTKPMNQLQTFDLQAFLREKIKDINLHKKATSIALGVAISRLLPLPSSAVDSAETHYLFGVKAMANEMLSAFNEAIVVDIELVGEAARTYWLIRYANAYPDPSLPMVSLGEFGFLTKLAGAGRYLNEETHAFCEKHSELMVVLINRITNVLKDKQV